MVPAWPSRAGQDLALLDAHPLYAGPGQELVAGRVPAGVPHVEEQAALVPPADVAREVVAEPGRDHYEAPPAEETGDLRRPLPQALLPLLAPALQGVLPRSRTAQQITAQARGSGPRASRRTRERPPSARRARGSTVVAWPPSTARRRRRDR